VGIFVAIDGTRAPVKVLEVEINAYRNGKVFISTNVLKMSDFKSNILFCSSVVEGSAHDSFVIEKLGQIEIINTLPYNNYV
jgi:hypothetical protein